ncbi:MAG TPA: hypothetical protein VJJ23_05270 [Candidatus Nanoarchaeia archaeon]|nr:hypothetical protein [Candidatus Nanoarchaeia archaeon]
MIRKPAKDIIKLIIKSLISTPKSINEVAEDCKSNWESIKQYLESLKEVGIVEETSVGNKRVFSITQWKIEKRGDTYFGLPLEQKDEKLIDSLFFKIKEEWQKNTGKIPGRTQLNKTLAKINNLCNLNLPIGWYQFGALCVKRYDPLIEYNYEQLSNETLICAQNVIKDYSKEISTYDLKIKQYKEEDKKLYITKELVLLLLTSQELSKIHTKELTNNLYNILFYLPKIEDTQSKRIINEFIATILQLFSVLPEEEFQNIKIDIIESFNSLWRLIALYQYSDDLEKYYPKEILIRHLNLDKDLQKIEVMDWLLYLNEMMPSEPESNDKNYQKLKSLMGSAKELTEIERDERNEEMEKIRKEKGEKGLQEFLLKKFKLN